MDLLKGKKILVLDTEYETNPKRLLSLSYLIINGTDMWDLLVDNKDSIYKDYLSSWYNWKNKHPS